MRKLRIYEYAKKVKMTSKEVIQHLKEMEIEVSNHMSTITEDTIKKLDQMIQSKSGSKQKTNSTKKQGKQENKKQNHQNRKKRKETKGNNKKNQPKPSM